MEFRTAYDPFRALGCAWRILWRAKLTMFLGGFLLLITDPWSDGPGGGTHQLQLDKCDMGNGLWPLLQGPVGIGLLLALILMFVAFLFHCLLRVGYGAAVQRVMVTGKEDIADLFRPRGLYGTMVFGMLLHILLVVLASAPFGLIVWGGFLIDQSIGLELPLALAGVCLGVCYFFVWIWILLGLLLIPEAIAIEGLDPVSAVSRSWSLTRGHRLMLFLYAFVQVVLVVASFFCLCCLGVFVTSTWSTIAWYESYVRLTMPERDGGLWIDAPEPTTST